MGRCLGLGTWIVGGSKLETDELSTQDAIIYTFNWYGGPHIVGPVYPFTQIWETLGVWVLLILTWILAWIYCLCSEIEKKKNHKIILVCGLKERKICKRGKGWNPRFCFFQLLSEERKNLYFIKKYLTMLIPNLYPFFITQNLWNKWKNSLITKSLPFFMKRTKEMKKIRIR